MAPLQQDYVTPTHIELCKNIINGAKGADTWK